MRELPFSFDVPATLFEKADAPEGKRRRIAGIISTETRDRQNEIVIQKGLDFTEFLGPFGFYNDNHGKEHKAVVGVPDPQGLKQFQKGDLLPNGDVAKSNLTWAEGHLLPNVQAAKDIWNLGRDLQKAGGGRGLGFSVEGGVVKRSGPNNKVIAKAKVRNVAITHHPVNQDTRMEVLAKSLTALEEVQGTDNQEQAEELIAKALTVGTTGAGFDPGSQPPSPATGEGAGRILSKEDLEKDKKKTTYKACDDKKKKKTLNKAEAICWLHERYPHLSATMLGRIVDTTLQLKRNGKLDGGISSDD